jgi:hypothetical protein
LRGSCARVSSVGRSVKSRVSVQKTDANPGHLCSSSLSNFRSKAADRNVRSTLARARAPAPRFLAFVEFLPVLGVCWTYVVGSWTDQTVVV